MSLLLLFLLLAAFVAACSSAQEGSDDPAAAVEDYLSAMVANETDKLPQLICPAYESGARTDFDSMGAVGGAQLDGVDCTTGIINDDTATVTCTGALAFSYNGENRSLDISVNTYLAERVDGEWKMCGYQQ